MSKLLDFETTGAVSTNDSCSLSTTGTVSGTAFFVACDCTMTVGPSTIVVDGRSSLLAAFSAGFAATSFGALGGTGAAGGAAGSAGAECLGAVALKMRSAMLRRTLS
jgi:hypothetical protein